MLSAILWLSLTVYHEAREESLEGQRAVAMVILNRAASRDKTIKQVVLEPRQFSCYNNGVKIIDDPSTYLKILYNMPNILMSGDNTGGAMYYHRVTVVPHWSKKMRRTKRIGKHIFYESNTGKKW